MTVLENIINSNIDKVIIYGKENNKETLKESIDLIKLEPDKFLDRFSIKLDGKTLNKEYVQETHNDYEISAVGDFDVKKDYYNDGKREHEHNITINITIYALIVLLILLIGYAAFKYANANSLHKNNTAFIYNGNEKHLVVSSFLY